MHLQSCLKWRGQFRFFLAALPMAFLVLAYCTPSKTSKVQSNAAPAAKGRRIEILFLGDKGHHRPIERLPALMAGLGPKGINFTYTDQLSDLNPENLSKFDGLLIYANHDSIGPVQEKALLDFVASGKGLIPLHCASFCFRNSKEYVKMVGGQFWRHRMDTIKATITQPTHPAMAGVEAFSAYDETYLHKELQPDNNVLMEREIKADQASDKPGVKTEPYTWTRTYGKGRVFYTAYGHDERTFDQPGFQTLVEKGILWAVGDEVKKQYDARNPQPFSYKEAKLPNYEKRPGPQLEQAALSPEESMKHMQVPVDFKLEMFAHEPDVMHPIAMTWDERGRLLVLITKDYPNERKEEGGSDYVLMCEDTNGDGKADKFTRYAEGLSIPTGLVCYDGGIIVSQAPHMLYLKDTDGDGKADLKKILFTGFGTSDTHAGPSNLHYGFDNWIWACVGYSGFKGKVGGDSLEFAQSFFRFKPDGSKMEHLTNTSNNTWGLGFNETGDVFGSTANNSHGWYMAIPSRYYHSSLGFDNGSRSIDTHKDMKPITPRVRQVDVFGGFTAAAGHNFYTARAFPKSYWNRVAFVNEPTGHVVHQNVMAKKGTDYEDVEGFNLLAGADEWVSPVFAQTGPDGAVWIADWYSFIIQHNPTPAGFGKGDGNAYETDLRDYTHGRIYRVSYNKAPAYTPLTLSKERPQELIAALKNSNMFWRQAAQRLLVERGQKDVVPQLIELVKNQSVDEIGINPTAIHALWTLHGLGALDGTNANALLAVQQALKHPDANVRKNAVQVLPANATSVSELLKADLLHDQEPLVVMNTLLALSQMPLSAEAEKALLTRLEQATEIEDRWLSEAFACVLTSNKGKLMKAYLKEAAKKSSAQSNASSGASNSHVAANHDHSMVHQTANVASTSPMATANVSTADNKPDLVITGLRTEPKSPSLRETVRIMLDVENRGGVAIPQGTPISVDIRIEGPGKATNIGNRVYMAGLEAGASAVIERIGNGGDWSAPLVFNSEQAGTFTISAMLDKSSTVPETNESNNSFSQKLIYSAPPSVAVYAMERAVRSYASVVPADSVVALLRQSQKLDEAGRQAILKGVTQGWGNRRTATLRGADKVFMASLGKTLADDDRSRLDRLMRVWSGQMEETAAPNAQVIQISVVKEALQFDKKEFTVLAGKPVEIVVRNPDAMQHNMVIGKPNSLETIGAAADKMITAKDGAERNYVPSISQVVAASPLINPEQSYRLKFTAPTTPGKYPFVCTFPGHWRIMNGIMIVK